MSISSRRTAAAILSAGAVVAMLAACSSTPSADADAAAVDGLADLSAAQLDYIEGLYDDAKAEGEGTITVYNAYNTLGPVFDLFSATFPEFEVNDVTISGSDAFARLDAEFAANGPEADATLSGISDVTYYTEKGYFTEFTPETAESIASNLYGENTWYTPFQTSYGLVYNADAIDEADLPTSFSDLADSSYEGRLHTGALKGFSPPDWAVASGLYSGTFTADELSAVLANVEFNANGPVDAQSKVAQGRYDIALWGPQSYVPGLNEKGANLKIAPLEDGQILNGPGFGVLEGAKHEAAAKLLSAWLFTPAAQTAFAQETYNYPVLEGIDIPEGFPARESYTIPQFEDSTVFGEQVREQHKVIAGILAELER